MTDAREAAQAALNELRRGGWTQNASIRGTSRCLGAAADRYRDARLTELVAEAIAGRKLAPAAAMGTIVDWNDAPGRTFEDVERLLRGLGADTTTSEGEGR